MRTLASVAGLRVAVTGSLLGSLAACAPASTEPSYTAKELFDRLEWEDVAWRAAVGGHDDCTMQDSEARELCCKALARDIHTHSRRIEDLADEGSLDSFMEAVVEYARLVDAVEDYCDDCGDFPLAAMICN